MADHANVVLTCALKICIANVAFTVMSLKAKITCNLAGLCQCLMGSVAPRLTRFCFVHILDTFNLDELINIYNNIFPNTIHVFGNFLLKLFVCHDAPFKRLAKQCIPY